LLVVGCWLLVEKQIPPLRYGMTSKWALRNDKPEQTKAKCGDSSLRSE
jgi:hypothetical protein